jgi:hypothetical protein
MAVKTLGKVTLLVGAVTAVSCGRAPLDLGSGGSGGSGGSAGNDGTAGEARGAGSGGGAGASTCVGLDEATCEATPGCQPQSCKVCSGAPTYAGCTTPGAPIECPGQTCIQPAEPCDMLLDEASCARRMDCTPFTCPDCMGGQSFVECAGPGEEVICAQCPGPPPCWSLDEMACAARSHCEALYCPNCSGGGQKFVGCGFAGESATCADGCPAPDGGTDGSAGTSGTTGTGGTGETCGSGGALCMTSLDCCPGFDCYLGNASLGFCGLSSVGTPCLSVATEMECDARSDCHSVFGGQEAGFLGCRDGAKATCNPITPCGVGPPDCAPGYVLAYASRGCYEGCVRPTECGP